MNRESLISVGKGALIAAAGAALTYLAQLPFGDFGPYGPTIGAVLSVVVNAGRKWLTSIVIVAVVAMLAPVPSFAEPPEVRGTFAVADVPPAVKDLDQVKAAPLAHSVVYVTQDLGGGRTAAGTGTAIAAENGKTLILTNAHVAQAGRPTSVTYWSEGKPYISPAKFLEGSTVTDAGPQLINVHGPDLALLVLEVAELRPVEFAAAIPAAGEAVQLYGFGGADTNGTTPLHKTGRTLAADGWQTTAGNPIQRTSINTVNGDSGAGIFNQAGQLVAVHWGGGAERLDTVHAFTGQVLERKVLFKRSKDRIVARRISAAIAKTFSLLPAAPTPPPVKEPAPVAAPVVSNCPGGVCKPTVRGRRR